MPVPQISRNQYEYDDYEQLAVWLAGLAEVMQKTLDTSLGSGYVAMTEECAGRIAREAQVLADYLWAASGS